MWNQALRGTFKAILTFDGSDRTRELIHKVDAILSTYHAAKLGAKILDQIEFRKVLVNGGQCLERKG